MGGHVREAPIEILGFWTKASVAAPALFHDFGHSLGTSTRDSWSVIDPRITHLANDLSRVLALVGDLSAVDLIDDYSYSRQEMRILVIGKLERQRPHTGNRVPKAYTSQEVV